MTWTIGLDIVQVLSSLLTIAKYMFLNVKMWLHCHAFNLSWYWELLNMFFLLLECACCAFNIARITKNYFCAHYKELLLRALQRTTFARKQDHT